MGLRIKVEVGQCNSDGNIEWETDCQATGKVYDTVRFTVNGKVAGVFWADYIGADAVKDTETLDGAVNMIACILESGEAAVTVDTVEPARKLMRAATANHREAA